VLCAVFVALAQCYVSAHFSDSRLHAFNIGVAAQGEKTVSMPLEQQKSTSTCTFSYRTGSPRLPVVKQVQAVEESDESSDDDGGGAVDLEAALARYRGQCVERVFGYWTYQLCFGAHFRQYHEQDIYMLGRTAEWAESTSTLEFADGDDCEASKPQQQPRRVSVSFGCLNNAPMPVVWSVTESATCEYAVVVGLRDVCGDQQFKILENANVAITTVEAPIDDGSEDFFLELAHLDDGRVMCSVYSTELRAAGSKLNFQEFELKIKPAPGVAQSQHPHCVARHPGRVPVGENELLVGRNRVQNSDDFDGRLSFLKITT